MAYSVSNVISSFCAFLLITTPKSLALGRGVSLNFGELGFGIGMHFPELSIG